MAFIAIGFVPAGYIANRISQADSRKGPIALAVSLIIGFAISALASTWSFGVIGADTYIYLVALFFVVSLTLLAFSKIRTSLLVWKEFTIRDIFLIGLPLLTSFLVKPYWSDLKQLRIAAGQGPDIPQNLMTALSQHNVGTTWFVGKNKLLEITSSNNLNEAVYHLYQLPSMQLQAGYDYLIYGTRWGLSIPFAQFLRLNPENLITGQGLSVTMGLISLAFVMYAFALIMKLRPTIAVVITLASVLSSGFLYQAYNGGMAQAWGLVGLAALSLGFFLTVYYASNHQLDRKKELGLLLLMILGWLGNAITYIDSSMILAGAFGLTSAFLYFVAERQVAKKSFLILISSGIFAAILAAPYTFAAIQTMALRLRLAAGTGVIFAHWPMPSEILGLFNIWTQSDGKPRDGGVVLAGVLLSIGIAWIALRGITSKNREEKTLSYLALSILLLCGAVAIWAKNTKLGSNYSYVKVSTYLSPLFLMILGHKLISNKKLNIKSRNNKFGLVSSYITPIAYIAIMFLSVQSANADMIKKAQYVVPAGQLKILSDPQAQQELSKYNYLTTYIPVSNILGVLGDTHWVGKAPNDQYLNDRTNLEMRIICFNADPVCKPKTPQIPNSALAKYGFTVFQSAIDSKTYASLKPLDRYYAAMDAVGQPRFEVPERFIGGNPLLK